MERLKKIGQLLRTQDNRITDAPMFIVEQKARIYGLDPQYGDGDYIWQHKDDPEYFLGTDEELEEEIVIGAAVKEQYEKVYYYEYWVFVTVCFTEQGCNDFLKINRHNLKEPRIFAAGSFRNEEFRAVREYLIGL